MKHDSIRIQWTGQDSYPRDHHRQLLMGYDVTQWQHTRVDSGSGSRNRGKSALTSRIDSTRTANLYPNKTRFMSTRTHSDQWWPFYGESPRPFLLSFDEVDQTRGFVFNVPKKKLQ